ncbi:MAG: methyl-accepting chemotaxis protein [Firmicutes bacterium]|nr:methyl-accepting chemotaxis protein [Bacillota bacterium]
MKFRMRIMFESWFFVGFSALFFVSFMVVGVAAFYINRYTTLVYQVTSALGYFLPLAILGLIFSFILASVVLFYVKRRINFVMRRALAEMKKFPFGNTDYKTRKNAKASVFDSLYASLFEAVAKNRELFEDINKMVDDHNIGFYDQYIDEGKYEAENKQFVQGINQMVAMYVDDYIELLNTFKSYSEGDFTVGVRTYQENWAWANKIMADLQNNFKYLIEETSILAENAKHGKFDVYANAHDFKGEWADMIKNLNDLMTNINVPLSDVEKNILLMSHGDFTLLEGKYHGKFEVLQVACNVVNNFIYAYVQEISEILEKISKGDLDITIHNDYLGSFAPIKAAINAIVQGLNSTMSELQQASSFVAEGAAEVASVSQKLAAGATTQAKSVDDLNNFIFLMNDIAERAGEKMTLTGNNAQLTQTSVSNASDSVENLTTTMNRLRVSSENISRINAVITNIAFQTNLLALNASVEAARAGEHGRGFSVVAEEVRNLATRSQESASETSTIVVEDLENVEDGLKITDEILSMFSTIENIVKEISQTMQEVTKIAQEQMQSVHNVSENIHAITRVTNDISETSLASSAAAEELSSQSTLLRDKIAFFKLKRT